MGDHRVGDTRMGAMLEAGERQQSWSLELLLRVLGAWHLGKARGHSYFLAQVAAQSLSTLSLHASLYSTWSGRDTMSYVPCLMTVLIITHSH